MIWSQALPFAEECTYIKERLAADEERAIMLALGRTTIFLAIGLTIVYLSLFFYLRSGARMRLEEDWVHDGRPGDRDEWIDERLAPRVARIRVWLVVLVYVVPVAAMIVFVWATN